MSDFFFSIPRLLLTSCCLTAAFFPGSLIAQDDCFDNCMYSIDLDAEGVAIHASLTPVLQDTPFFFFVTWSLDDGATTGTGLEFNQLIKEPGRHKICATYPTGDFSPETCTVCKAFDVTALCVDSSKIDSAACPLIYVPVCGCDGVTYNNSCEAMHRGGVTAWTPGVCGSVCNNLFIDFEGFNSGGSLTYWTFNDLTSFPGGQVSSWVWDFGNGQISFEQNPSLNFLDPGDYVVCLTVSGLFADGTQCGTQRCKTIHIGEQLCVDLSVIDTMAICPAIYAPVCGCDGITYDNDCMAYYYHGVTEWTPGICPELCINPAWIDKLTPCIGIYDPVCGCDAQTYTNECYAVTHGITSWKAGACCEEQSCQAGFTVQQLSGFRVLVVNNSVNAATWNLDFGDGIQHTGAFDSLYHTYAGKGTYQICLQISDLEGTCTDVSCSLVSFGVLGVSNSGAGFSCKIQPNPANDQITIQTDGAMMEFAVLMDVYGKVVLTPPVSGSASVISMGTLPAGFYFLHIRTDKGAVTRKIALQH